MQIEYLVKGGGGQLLRLKVADIIDQSHTSKVSYLQQALQGFGFLMLKYELSHILETLFLSSTSTLKVKTSTFNLH